MTIKNYSPLRYPGGKAKLIDTFKNTIEKNNFESITYIEPFAGGSNIALALLIDNYVSNIIINDIDKSIYCFWTSILKHTNKFIKKIEECDITLKEREKQKNIFLNTKQYSEFDIGFALFFLNRTNYSGIIKAGPIGGINQFGKYKINARFNKEELIKKISIIADYKDRILVTNEDSIQIIDYIKHLNNCLVYFDPPYYQQGKNLYTNFYQHSDHVALSENIKSLNIPWILTYDNIKEIKTLYADYNMSEFLINYSAYKHTTGKEVMFFNNIQLPPTNYLSI